MSGRSKWMKITIGLDGGNMAKNNRVALIGGGSINWTPTFLHDLSMCQEMMGGEIVLYDTNTEALQTMLRFGEKLMSQKQCDITLSIANSLEESLVDANFVVCSVLVGAHSLWKDEMNIIHAAQIEHPKGMSVGPGGLSMSLRQVPWVVDLAHQMETICPQAWLLNFSNPMQTISLAVERYSKIKYMGLCHGVTHTIEKMANQIGIPAKELSYTLGGVNHFEIIKSLTHNGESVLDQVAEAFERSQKTSGRSNELLTTEVYRLFGGFPCNEDIHSMEFLPHYIHKGTRLEDYEQTHNFIENRIKNRAGDWHQINGYLNDTVSLSEIVEDDSGEKLADIIKAIVTNEETCLFSNVTNRGYIPNLHQDMAVEVPVVLNRDGYKGVCIGEMPKALAALSNLHGTVQDLTVEAAMTGSYQLALQALSLDPMCYTLNLQERRELLSKLIKNSIDYLPNFTKGGA